MSTPVSGPLPQGLFPPLALSLLGAGLLASAAFYMREAIGGRKRSLAQEAALATAAAGCLGFGTVFLLLWCGVYLG
ncbi:hypothetical protein ABPG75_006623 [Micractinium tetrahymenae]